MRKQATTAAAKPAATVPEPAPDSPAAPAAAAESPASSEPVAVADEGDDLDEDLDQVLDEAPRPSRPGTEIITPTVLAYARGELASAEATLRNGPAGEGWTHNETKRAAAEEIAAFLRVLVGSLEEVTH